MEPVMKVIGPRGDGVVMQNSRGFAIRTQPVSQIHFSPYGRVRQANPLRKVA